MLFKRDELAKSPDTGLFVIPLKTGAGIQFLI